MIKRRPTRERHYPVPHEPFMMWLCVNSQKGQKPIEVEVVQKYPSRTKIRALVATQMAGRGKLLAPGDLALIPNWQLHKTPVEFTPPPKPEIPFQHWRVTVMTTAGRRVRYYRTRHQSAAREQAKKVKDVDHVVQMMACTAEEYEQYHEFRNQGKAS